jgi:hypothetical protein
MYEGGPSLTYRQRFDFYKVYIYINNIRFLDTKYKFILVHATFPISHVNIRIRGAQFYLGAMTGHNTVTMVQRMLSF